MTTTVVNRSILFNNTSFTSFTHFEIMFEKNNILYAIGMFYNKSLQVKYL